MEFYSRNFTQARLWSATSVHANFQISSSILRKNMDGTAIEKEKKIPNIHF